MLKLPNQPDLIGLPYNEWRTGQREVVEEILSSPARVVLLRARTGFGKAAVALALSYLSDNGGLILTHTHQLQDQYGKLGAAIVKGRPNFWCEPAGRMGMPGESCLPKWCAPGRCEYATQKYEGEMARVTTTNYAYACRVLRSGSFSGRSWMVCDEAQHIADTIETVMVEEEEEAAAHLRDKLYKLGHTTAARQVAPAPPPLWPGQEFPDRIMRHADRILVMSATLPPLQVWAYLHNVSPADILYINAPDTWPNNSPLVIWPVVSLRHGSPSHDLDKLAISIQQILAEHPDQKGLIHAHSYNLMREMYERIHDERILWGFERKQAIQQFMAAPAPAVLFAAAVHEGFDLPYELGFQIIPKVPFPDLGSPQVKKRAKAYKAWYAMETINAIAQAWGRVVRAPDDFGVTYILDAAALRMIREWPDMWPPWIRRQTSVWAVD